MPKEQLRKENVCMIKIRIIKWKEEVHGENQTDRRGNIILQIS